MTPTLTIDMMLDWMVDNLAKGAMANLLEAVEQAADRAEQMVSLNPLSMPSADELVVDKVFYYLRDRLEIHTSHHDDDAGVRSWSAYRNELDGSPHVERETEIGAIAALLRLEEKQFNAMIER